MPSSNRLRVPVASSEQRFRTLIPIGLLFIVVLIILGTLTPLGDTLMQHISSSPSPVPTIAPGDDLFYIRVAPNWGAISIDGHMITHVPAFPPDSPLLLSRGVHIISWHADPFLPRSCTISIPSLPQQRCPYESLLTSQPPSNQPNARVIEFDASLQDMTANLRNSLVAQTQLALNALQSAATVQPGELYARLPSPQVAAATATTATQPLHALLRFHLDLNPNSNRTLGFSGTNCLQFCTSIYDQPSGNPGQHIWIAEAPYYPGWDYRTFSGQVVAQGQPDSTTTDGTTTDYAAYFDIQWVNQAWHVVVDSTF